MIQIIQATLSNLTELAILFDTYRQFYEQESDLTLAKNFLRQRIENNESIIFMAYDDGKALGFTQLYPSFSSVSAQRLWILNDLFVIFESRGKGIGEALLLKAQSFVRKTNAKGLSLETHKINPAQKLYERLGWQNDQDYLHYFWRA